MDGTGKINIWGFSPAVDLQDTSKYIYFFLLKFYGHKTYTTNFDNAKVIIINF